MNDHSTIRWVKSMPALLVYRLLLAMLIYSLSRGVFYLYNADLLHFEQSADILTAYRGGLRFDLTALLYINLLVVLLSLLPHPVKYRRGYQRTVSWIYWICNVPPFILNLGDTIYYRFTKVRTTLEVFSEFANENGLHFLRFFVDYWHLTLLGIALLGLWILLYRLVKPSSTAPASGWRYYLVSSLTFVIGGVCVVGGIRGGLGAGVRPLGPNFAALYITRPEQRAFVLNTPFAMIRLLGKQPLPEFAFMPPEEARKLYSAEHRPDPNARDFGAFKGRNVVIIIWESLSREWVGGLNGDIPGYQGFTPFIDSLLKKSYYFEHAYASGGKSIDAMPAILSSIPKPNVPFISSIYSGNRVNSIASLAHTLGYRSRFYHNSPNGSMGFDAMAKQMGFQEYHGMTEYNHDEDFDGNWGIWDEPFLQYIAKDLNTLPEPFIATEFTTSSHHPFEIPKAYEARFPRGQHQMHRCIRYTDYALEQFFKTARQQPWYQNTLFVITADHAVDGFLKEYKNPVGQYAIPLIFFDPRGDLLGVDSAQTAGQVDILPTLAHLLGVQEPFIAFGRNLRSERHEGFVVQPVGGVFQMIEGRYALQFDGQDVVALYDLQADRFLEHNLRNERPDVIQRMLPHFKAYLQEFSLRLRENKLAFP